MYNTAMVGVLLLNGIAPVNTCISTKRQLAKAIRAVDHLTYLNHDHRKRKCVRLLAECSLCQDLWRSPSRGVTTLMRGAPDGIQVLSDCGKAEICDQRITGVVHKDVWLTRCQYGGKGRHRTTYSLEVTMDHVAGMEVAEASGDVG